MSAVESAQRAARLTDPIGHGLGLLGMIGGMILGAVVGAILVAGAIATGGALLIAVASFAAIGCVAGGGLAGGQLVRGLQKATGLPDPQTGVLGPMASLNVRIGNLFAARVTDTAVECDGLMTLIHPIPIPLVPIAEGAQTVRINNLLAARVTSKLVCGAKIKDGEPTVVIGGPTQRVLPVHDPEEELGAVLGKMLLVSLIGVVILQPEAIIPILGFMVLNEAAGDLADAIWGPDSGARDIVQGLLGLGAIVAMGARGLKGLEEPTPEEQAEQDQAAREQAEREQAEREARAKEEAARRQKEEAQQRAREKLEQRRAAARQQKLRDAIQQAEKDGKLNDLDPADRDWLNDDPTGRRKELAYDPDTGSFKPNEARAALQAEQDGTLDAPVRRAFDDSGRSGGADYVDGKGEPWDVKDASAGADKIIEAASPKGGKPGENILVDCSNMTPQQQEALEQQIANNKPPGSGDIVFVPRR